MHNSVISEGECCAICLDKYGTLSRETGTIEVAIRLPCNHLIGSACIATWLQENNSCPICRREFFPARPRPYLEHGILDSEENNYLEEDEVDEAEITERNAVNCNQLSLEFPTTMLSEMIAQRLTEWSNWSRGHTAWCTVAVSIYIASHLAYDPRSPREIAAVTQVDADHVRFTYDNIHPDRARLVDDADLRFLLENEFEEVPHSLNWPQPGYEQTDEQIEGGHVSAMLKRACQEGCRVLGLDTRIADFSFRVAEILHDDTNVRFAQLLSSRSMSAVGIFMVCRMACNPISQRRVVEAVGASESEFSPAYHIAYTSRIFEEAWIGEIGMGSVESCWARLPLP